ncbi:MAG: hypothetical protein AABZ77_01070, partial [Chloroflexota bacterium]
NLTRSNLWEDWIKRNIRGREPDKRDSDNLACVARALNRIGADIEREDGLVVKLLSSRLADRLGCGVNLKYLWWLGAIIRSLYTGAEEYLKSIDLQG